MQNRFLSSVIKGCLFLCIFQWAPIVFAQNTFHLKCTESKSGAVLIDEDISKPRTKVTSPDTNKTYYFNVLNTTPIGRNQNIWDMQVVSAAASIELCVGVLGCFVSTSNYTVYETPQNEAQQPIVVPIGCGCFGSLSCEVTPAANGRNGYHIKWMISRDSTCTGLGGV